MGDATLHTETVVFSRVMSSSSKASCFVVSVHTQESGFCFKTTALANHIIKRSPRFQSESTELPGGHSIGIDDTNPAI